MDTQELDAVLTEWGRQSRAAAGWQPVPEFATRPRRPRHFGWQLAAGAVAVAVAAAVAVAVPRLLAKDGPADPLHGVTSTAPTVPAGFQVVTFHGLSITVPASWQVHAGRYCQLTRSVIELPTAFTYTCLRPTYPNLTIVDFYDGIQPSSGNVTHTTISGLPATRVQNNTGRLSIGYTVPSLSVSVVIWPAAGQTGEDLAASLTVDAIDSHGCPARITDGDTFPPRPTAGRSGTANALIPGQPSSMTACRYVQGWLNQGATVSGAALRSFEAIVNGLPPGLSRAAGQSYNCARPPGAPPAEADVYRFQLRYPSGPPVSLSARASYCGKSGVADGSRTGQLTRPLGILLSDTVGTLGTIPDPVVPVR